MLAKNAPGSSFLNNLWVQIKRYPLLIFITAVLLFLVLVPLTRLVITSFVIGHPAMPKGYSFEAYRYALTMPLFYSSLGTTLFLAVTGTIITLSIAILFAWLIERTDMPFRNVSWVLLLVPLAMPGILFALSWGLLLGPKGGVINIVIRNILAVFNIHLESGPFDIYSLGGLVFLDGLRGVSTAFLMIVGGFRIMDPALEEAARVSKAGRVATLFKVVLPLMMPTLLLAAMYRFILIMESFEIPMAIGLPVGIYVLSTLIFFTSRVNIPVDFAVSSVFALVLMFLMVLLIVAYRYALRHFQHYATVTGKGYRPRVITLGKWRYPAFGVFFLYFFFTVMAPMLILMWGSIMPSYRPPSWEALQLATLAKYIEIFTRSDIVSVMWNTVQVMLVTASATMVLSLFISWIVIRTRLPGRGILDGMAFIPQSIPGIVIGLALIMVFLTFPFNRLGLYGTVWVIVIALLSQYIAFGTRIMNGAIIQIHKELEEAAYVSKAGTAKTIVTITLPLLFPAFVAGWVWSAVEAMRSFGAPLMLASRKSAVISVMLWSYWNDGSISLASALGVILMLVLIPLTLVMRRFIVQISGQGS